MFINEFLAVLQVGPDAFEQAASGGGPGGGPFTGGGFNPFEDMFSGFGGGGSDVCKLLLNALHLAMECNCIVLVYGICLQWPYKECLI